MANILKLPFCKYFNKNLMTTSPTAKLTKIPKKKAKLHSKCLNSYKAAASTIGVDNRKE